MTHNVHSFQDDSGQGLVEYALILALIAFGLIGILFHLSNATGNVYHHAGTEIEQSTSCGAYGAASSSNGTCSSASGSAGTTIGNGGAGTGGGNHGTGNGAGNGNGRGNGNNHGNGH